MSTRPQVPLAQVRAFWWQRQRLEDRALVVPADVARSLVGSGEFEYVAPARVGKRTDVAPRARRRRDR